MIKLKTYSGRVVEFEEIVFYTVDVKNGKIKFIATPQVGEKDGGRNTQGEINYSREAHDLFKTYSKRIEKIEGIQEGNVIVKYKNGPQVKYMEGMLPALQKMKEEQYHYDNDGVSIVEGRNYTRNHGKMSPGAKRALAAGLALLLLGGITIIPEVKETLRAIVCRLRNDDYSVYTPNLMSTGNKETDTLGSTLYGALLSNNLPILENGFKVDDTIVTADENFVRDAVALLNSETPESMEAMSKEDYALRARAIAQFWVNVAESSLNPNNPAYINISDYVKDLEVTALLNNALIVTRSFMADPKGKSQIATFIPSRSESVKLDEPSENNEKRFIIYQLQSEGDSVVESQASDTAKYILYSMFAYGNEHIIDKAFVYEGEINGEPQKWVYKKYLEDKTGGRSFEIQVESDGRVSYYELDSKGRKTGKVYTEREMEDMDEKDINIAPQGYTVYAVAAKEEWLGELQKKPGYSYTK